MPASLIVRDLADYPSEAEARASLPEMYADYPYLGVLRLGGTSEAWVYVFSTDSKESLLADGWVEQPL